MATQQQTQAAARLINRYDRARENLAAAAAKTRPLDDYFNGTEAADIGASKREYLKARNELVEALTASGPL